MLEQDIIRKGREFLIPKFEPDNNKEYKVETVQSMLRKQTDTFQGYTIWLHGRVT